MTHFDAFPFLIRIARAYAHTWVLENHVRMRHMRQDGARFRTGSGGRRNELVDWEEA